MQDKIAQSERLAMQVSINSIIVNLILSVGKLAAGILANSAAMISDAIHSASDVFSTFIVMAGVKISNKASDAVISIIVKEGMFWYTKKAAAKINSSALMADAWHHRSDALSSIGSFIGILGARMGYPALDPLASVVICLMIVYASYEIFKDAIDKMVDRSCDEATINTMTALISAQKGVDHIDVLQTRKFGCRIYVDVEVSADDDLTLLEAHTIAENIHKAIESNFSEVKHCMVHVNPCSEVHHD